MKFSNGTEFRFAAPKYSCVWTPLFGFGFAMVIIPKFPNWRIDIGILLLAAGLVVFLVGTVAERREWEAKRQAEKK